MTAVKRCFVISPIGDEGSKIRHHADDVFEFIIKPAMEPLGIEAVRSDHMSETGQITEQMFGEILGADLCVAVLTGHNANVFYELAIAQCAARPLILLIEKGQPLPFDVKDLRAIEYRLSPISRLVTEGVYAKRVRAQVESILDDGRGSKGLFEEYDFPELRSERQVRRMFRSAVPSSLPPGEDKRYALPSGQELVILTGDVKELHGHKIDTVVSLSDTFLQLARYYGETFSGSLRYMDAEKSDAGGILEDSLNNSLQQVLREDEIELPVRLGSVIATPTTQLEKDYGIRYVMHVAAMHGSAEDGYKMRRDVIGDCVRNIFRRFGTLAEQERDSDSGLDSMLLPMLGAATTNVSLEEIARRLLRHVTRRLERTPACRTIYLLAWLESHRFAVHRIAVELGLEEAVDGASLMDRKQRAA